MGGSRVPVIGRLMFTSLSLSLSVCLGRLISSDSRGSVRRGQPRIVRIVRDRRWTDGLIYGRYTWGSLGARSECLAFYEDASPEPETGKTLQNLTHAFRTSRTGREALTPSVTSGALFRAGKIIPDGTFNAVEGAGEGFGIHWRSVDRRPVFPTARTTPGVSFPGSRYAYSSTWPFQGSLLQTRWGKRSDARVREKEGIDNRQSRTRTGM